MLLEHQLNEMNCKWKIKFLTMQPWRNYNNRRRTYLLIYLLHYCSALWPSKGRFTHSIPFPCRAHAVPLPCRAAKCLEYVFPIWFTQCGRVWFTLAMPRPCHALTMPFSSRPRHTTACGLPARVRLLPATTRSSTKIVIRSIPVILTTNHTYDCKDW